MSGFFNPDNWFWKFFGKAFDFFGLSCMWLLSSMFIITAGPASIACYDAAAHCMRRGEKNMAGRFFGTLKRELVPGLLIAPPHIGDEMEQSDVMPAMGLGCAAKSRELAKHYAVVAQNQGCAFLDAEGVAEFNEVDYMHLTRKGHAQLAAKLAEIVPTLV